MVFVARDTVDRGELCRFKHVCGVALIIVRKIYTSCWLLRCCYHPAVYTFVYLWALPGVNGWFMTLLSWLWVLLLPIFGKNAVAINAFLPLVAIYFIYRQTEGKTSNNNNTPEDPTYASVEAGMQK
jgi:hypothetical protein